MKKIEKPVAAQIARRLLKDATLESFEVCSNAVTLVFQNSTHLATGLAGTLYIYSAFAALTIETSDERGLIRGQPKGLINALYDLIGSQLIRIGIGTTGDLKISSGGLELSIDGESDPDDDAPIWCIADSLSHGYQWCVMRSYDTSYLAQVPEFWRFVLDGVPD